MKCASPRLRSTKAKGPIVTLLWPVMVFLLCPTLGADDRFSHLGIQQGLSERVLSIAQDHAGFMWFGTQAGLFRYDGHRLRKLTHDPDDPGSLANNYVRSLLADSHGDLWVATTSGELESAVGTDGVLEGCGGPRPLNERAWTNTVRGRRRRPPYL